MGRAALTVAIVLAVAWGGPATAQAQEERSAEVRLGLAAAIRKLDVGPAGAIARAELDRYVAMRRRAQWAVLHDLELTSGFGMAPTCEADPNNPGQCLEEIDPMRDWHTYRPTFEVRGEGTVLLYTFGKLRSARAHAEVGIEAAHRGAAAQRMDLVRSIKEAYWGAVVSRELVDMLVDARDRLARELERRQQRLRERTGGWESDEADEDEDEDEDDEGEAAAGGVAGAATAGTTAGAEQRSVEELELEIAEVAQYLAKADGLLARARSALRVATETLRIAVGSPPSTRIVPEDEHLVPVAETLPPLAELRTLALSHNPTLRLAEIGERAASAELARAEANLWPNIVLGAGVRTKLTGGADCLVDPDQPAICKDAQTGYGYGYLAMRWNLDYPELLSQYQEVGAKYRRAVATRDAARLLAEQSVTQAYYGAEEQLALLAAHRSSERWARRARTLRVAHCGGLEIIDDSAAGPGCDQGKLYTALRAHLEARGQRLQTVYALNNAVAKLSAAVGQGVGGDLLPPPAWNQTTSH